ncbi:MAG: DUF4012 domain-containing protein, partial [Chloroflexi bacterium]|nr:DUF4012 domain-containing protein [Chloroflexota bacterium]
LRQQFDTIAGYRGAQRILLLGQNEHEIRATGGFIGTMGMVTLQDGKIVAQEFGGSESFAPGRHKTPPAEFKSYYGAGGWFVRDANWWPDFPTSARAALSFVEHDRKVNLHAVVAIDTTMIGLLISHLGSIEIPEVTAPDSQRSAAEWRTERATLEYAKPLGPPGALLTATAGTDRHAFAYARPGAVKPGDRVQLSVVARAETARWMNFGDPSDTEWHASFFDLERGVAGGRVGSLDAVRIEPEPALGTGWYRATVAYTVKTNSNLTAWVEVAGGDGATGGFTASGTESIRFDQIRVTVNGTRLPPACNEGGGTDATWSAASGGTPCARPLAFPDPLTAANWLSQVESNFVAAPVEGRKQAFLQPVIEAILARVQESRPRDAVALIRAVAAGIEGRHLQAYYESSEVEALVTAFGADGRLHAPDGLEMLAVVDANISESKVQPAITRDVTYLRRADGNVDLVIRWTNRLSSIDRDRFQRIAASGVKYDPATNTWRKVPGIYGAYVRIILPAGATASDITGFTFPPRWHHEEGYAVISGFIRVEDGQSQRVIVTYQPNQQGARGVYLWKQGG